MHTEFLNDEDYEMENLPEELENLLKDKYSSFPKGKYLYNLQRTGDSLKLYVFHDTPRYKTELGYIYLGQYFNNCGIVIVGELKCAGFAEEFLLEKAIYYSRKMRYTKLQVSTISDHHIPILEKLGFELMDKFKAVRTGNSNYVYQLSLQEN